MHFTFSLFEIFYIVKRTRFVQRKLYKS